MSWKIDEIRAERTAAVLARVKDRPFQDLLQRIIDLETALYPFARCLGSLDDKLEWHRAGMRVTSKLFPLWDGDDKVVHGVKDAEGRFRSVTVDVPPPEALHTIDYFECESVHFGKDQGGKLDDSFELLGVHQSGMACYIGCGCISMADVRRAVKTLENENVD